MTRIQEIQKLRDIIRKAIEQAADGAILELAIDDTGIAVFPAVGRVDIHRCLAGDTNPIPSFYWASVEAGGNDWGHGEKLNFMVGDPDDPEGRSAVDLRDEMLPLVDDQAVVAFDDYQTVLQNEDLSVL